MTLFVSNSSCCLFFSDRYVRQNVCPNPCNLCQTPAATPTRHVSIPLEPLPSLPHHAPPPSLGTSHILYLINSHARITHACVREDRNCLSFMINSLLLRIHYWHLKHSRCLMLSNVMNKDTVEVYSYIRPSIH